VLDERKRAIGYFAYDSEKDKCCASEIGGTDVRIFETVLGFLASRAIKLRREEITFKLPVDHPFSRWARQFGLKDASAYPGNGNAMARIADLQACFKSLVSELDARFSGFTDPAGFRLVTDIGSLHFSRARGKIVIGEQVSRAPIVRIDQNHLTQLLMGYKSPTDLMLAGTMKSPQSIQPYLEKLFPLQTSQMWWSDRF
jgi:predicted acetyltransferase